MCAFGHGATTICLPFVLSRGGPPWVAVGTGVPRQAIGEFGRVVSNNAAERPAGQDGATAPGLRVLRLLLRWFMAYRDLFTAPCNACGKHIELANCSWLPPTFRGYVDGKAYHTECIPTPQ